MSEVKAVRVSIYGLFDNHCAHRIVGRTVDDIIDSWLETIAEPIEMRFEDDRYPDGVRVVPDVGPSALCPAIVLGPDNLELRRVGRMVHPDYKTRKAERQEDLEAYRTALLADPDIPRLLAESTDRFIPPQKRRQL